MMNYSSSERSESRSDHKNYKIFLRNVLDFARTIIALLLIILPLIVTPTPVFAHVLESSGSVGAVLHIDPEDDPIVGEQSGFFFEFKDKQGKFKPQNCDCTFSIIEDGKEIYTQPLFQDNP